MTELDALLAGIVADSREETRWLVLADWLQEYDDPRRAELLRLHRCMLATCCEPDAHPQRAEWQSRMVELLVAGVRPCVPQETLTLPGGVPMTFSFIPLGAFLMGSEKGGEYETVHRVEIERGFFMGIYPVTQAQWFAVMGTYPSNFNGAEKPVEAATWEECQEFCAKLREHTDRRVELPTEAEWEYTCRAGTTTEYHFGDVLNIDLANRAPMTDDEDSPMHTTDVGSFPANAWSLHDLHGNVWEWCVDWFRSYPTDEPDRLRLQTGDQYRIQRGGCWCSDPFVCRAAYRGRDEPTSRAYDGLGFRVCLRL